MLGSGMMTPMLLMIVQLVVLLARRVFNHVLLLVVGDLHCLHDLEELVVLDVLVEELV